MNTTPPGSSACHPQPAKERGQRALWLALALIAMPTFTQATEEPEYQVVQQLGDVELRAYPPLVVAEVLLQGAADSVGNQAFPILAGYIFGKNKGERKLAMTAPVTQVATPTQLAMTAPVTQSPTGSGFAVQFVLPRGTTLATAPVPLDERVQLREMPARRLAVIRYSGFWSDANYNEHLLKLQQALKAADLRWAGEPVYARYNPPYTPWFLRRNEIWLHLP